VNGAPEQPPAPPDPVTAALKDWRQGDCLVADDTFVHRFRPGEPLTEDAKRIDDGNNEYVESDVRGLVVVSQSCDVVRNATAKPFIEVSPLVSVSAGLLHEIKKLRRPNYVFIPSLEGAQLVGDLDRTMTVEKSVVARWERTVGCRTDQERASFAWALSRKRARFAFPDDFNEWVAPLQERVAERHDKQSPEGRALRAVDEIRVKADPNWSADPVELAFYFIREEGEAEFEGKRWDAWLADWLKLVPASGRFACVAGLVGTLDDFMARDLRESALLDLDYLSERE
jgi:hypothetical protein